MCKVTTRDNLKNNIHNWRTINASSTVQNWIKEGIKLPFVNEPPSYCSRNHNLNDKQKKFISSEVEKLVSNGCLIECASNYVPQCVSSIGCVDKKNGKLRFITDLRPLNEYIQDKPFKYEGIEAVKEEIKFNDRLVTYDLKDGFFHIPVNSEFYKYLGIQWNHKFYVWTVLPFGLKCSPYFFYKVLRPIVQYLRENNIRVVFYVDDAILMCQEKYVTDHMDFIEHTLQDLGFVINWEKSQIVPSTSKLFIGYIVDSVGDGKYPWIKVPRKKIRKLKRDIRNVLSNKRCTAKLLACIAGQCVSMTKAIIPGKLLLRNVYKLLSTRKDWYDVLTIDEQCENDLLWWTSALESWNGAPIKSQPVDIQIKTDASSTGWGAVCDNSLEASGIWNLRVGYAHSNYRELLAILMGIRSFGEILKNKMVQILTDNIAATAYINHLGGPSLQLNQIAKAIWAEAYHLNIDLQAKHLAGIANQHADRLSRLNSPYEWRLHPRLFRQIDRMWGPHTCDRFASLISAQVKKYNTMYYDPKTSGIDALAQTDWKMENNFVNCPFFLIPKVLRVVSDQKAEATIIAPKWPAQTWYRKLLRMSTSAPLRIKLDWRSITQTISVPEPLKNKNWRIYCWRISGRDH